MDHQRPGDSQGPGGEGPPGVPALVTGGRVVGAALGRLRLRLAAEGHQLLALTRRPPGPPASRDRHQEDRASDRRPRPSPLPALPRHAVAAVVLANRAPVASSRPRPDHVVLTQPREPGHLVLRHAPRTGTDHRLRPPRPPRHPTADRPVDDSHHRAARARRPRRVHLPTDLPRGHLAAVVRLGCVGRGGRGRRRHDRREAPLHRCRSRRAGHRPSSFIRPSPSGRSAHRPDRRVSPLRRDDQRLLQRAVRLHAARATGRLLRPRLRQLRTVATADVRPRGGRRRSHLHRPGRTHGCARDRSPRWCGPSSAAFRRDPQPLPHLPARWSIPARRGGHHRGARGRATPGVPPDRFTYVPEASSAQGTEAR